MNYDLPRLIARLTKIADCTVKTDEVLAPYTSYNIGGPTVLWVAPETEGAVGRALETIHTSGAPLVILGRRSNLLISDQGWSGVTLYMGENMNGWTMAATEAQVFAGTLLTLHVPL